LKIVILVFFLSLSLFGEDFISEFEYGQMLYKNPRGVSCASCHGDLGEGAYIASIKDKNGTIDKYYGPDIRKLNFKIIKKAISNGGKIMPRYYLTDKEMEAIFKYIKIINNYEKKSEDDDVETKDDNLTEIVVDDNYSLDDNSSSNNTILGKIFKDKEE